MIGGCEGLLPMPQISPQADGAREHPNDPTDPQLQNLHSPVLTLNSIKSSCHGGTDTLPLLQACTDAFILSPSPYHHPTGHFQVLRSVSTPRPRCSVWPSSCRGTVCPADLALGCAFDPATFTAQGAEPSCQTYSWFLYCWILPMKACRKLYANSQVTAAE